MPTVPPSPNRSPLSAGFLRLPLYQRLLLVLVLFPAVLAGGTAGAFYLRMHQDAAAASVREMPAFPAPRKNKPYLILAPHCDDETLAVGGFVADATRRGATVSVAFLTNGDGFPAAATRELQTVSVSPGDYVRFAERRQAEANRATRDLGVSPGNVYFLGYPDRGLRPLWETHWQTPYRSFYTGHTRSPYPVSYTPHTVYTGQSLQNDLVRLITVVQPTDVFVTHPADDHPDHSAAASFAQVALRACALMPWAKNVQLHYYIVHRGDWPLPQGKHPDASLSPPRGLVYGDTRWRAYRLTQAAETAKAKALSRYVSQLHVSRRFLTSFVRTNELFAEMPTPIVPANCAEWTKIAVDGRRDDIVRFVDPSADLTTVAIRRHTANTITVQASVRGVADTVRLRYTLLVRGSDGAVRTLLLSPTTDDVSAHTLTATVLLTKADTPCLYVAVETRYQATASLPMRPVDRVGYRPVLLSATVAP